MRPGTRTTLGPKHTRKKHKSFIFLYMEQQRLSKDDMHKRNCFSLFEPIVH
jgi:hypothetical protein